MNPNMNPNIVDPLPAGAMTWGGKTQGPAINMGRVRPHMVGGRMNYVHELEFRDMAVKFGYPLKEDHERLQAECESLKDLLADADAKISELEDKSEALERSLGWKPKEPKATKSSTKKAA